MQWGPQILYEGDPGFVALILENERINEEFSIIR